MRKALRQASQQPRLEAWVRDVATAVSAGGKLVPESSWTKLGNWFCSLEETEIGLDERTQELEAAGFRFISNHARSQDHQEWIEFELGRTDLPQQYDHGLEIWFIPVDELMILVLDDPYAADGVELGRLIFVGNEQELTEAIDRLVS